MGENFKHPTQNCIYFNYVHLIPSVNNRLLKAVSIMNAPKSECSSLSSIYILLTVAPGSTPKWMAAGVLQRIEVGASLC